VASEQSKPVCVCIGPGCSKQALPDSVYCSTDCILQHAAVNMKSETGRKRGRAVELKSSVEDEDVEDRTLVNQQASQPRHEQQRPESSPGAAVVLYSDSPSKALGTGSDPLDRDLDLSADGTRSQYDDAVEDRRFEKERSHRVFDSEGSDPDALYCICRQKHSKRYVLVASQKQMPSPTGKPLHATILPLVSTTLGS